MDDNRYHCNAIIGRKPGRYGEEFVFCSQSVGVRQYWVKTAAWENSGHSVYYCSLPGHEANVRRRFEEKDAPEPTWLHEDPDFIDHPADTTFADKDPIDVYKWNRDRMESWTMAEDGSVTVAVDYTRTDA